MKKHFLSLIDTSQRWWTVSYFLLFIVLFVAAAIVNITDNPPGIAMLFFSSVFLILSLVHPWHRASNYGIMAGVCALIIVLFFAGIHVYASLAEPKGINQKTDGIIEAIAIMSIFFICVPGIVVGISGAIYRNLKSRDE